jgi:hypothetical protein
MCFLSFKDVNIFATANMETDKVISAQTQNYEEKF